MKIQPTYLPTAQDPPQAALCSVCECGHLSDKCLCRRQRPNYNFVVGPDSNVTVTPAPLTVTATAVDRVYDGTANVTVNFGTLLGILNNDQVYLSTSTVTGTVADMNVGSGKEVTFTIPALAGAKAATMRSVSNLPARANISGNSTPPAVSFSLSYDPQGFSHRSHCRQA